MGFIVRRVIIPKIRLIIATTKATFAKPFIFIPPFCILYRLNWEQYSILLSYSKL
jgi:hypothetical protein